MPERVSEQDVGEDGWRLGGTAGCWLCFLTTCARPAVSLVGKDRCLSPGRFFLGVKGLSGRLGVERLLSDCPLVWVLTWL